MPGSAPHSLAAEQAVIGSLLCDNGVFSRIAGLTSDHFFNPVHAKLFDDISKTIQSGRIADPISLKQKVDAEFREEYLASLILAATSTASAVEYSKIVKEESIKRQVINACGDAIEKMKDGNSDGVYPLLDGHLSEIARIQRQGTGQQSFASVSDAVAALFANEAPLSISTGWQALDRISGFPRGGVTIIGGRASMGKSAFLIEAAFNAARRGLRVDLFSMEMDKTQIAARAISSQMARTERDNAVSYHSIIERRTPKDRLEAVRQAARELPKINLDDTPRLSVSDIKARCLDKPGQIDLIFVDYLNIADLSDCKQADRHDQKLGLVCSRLRDFAKDIGAAIVLLCQLNRGATNRENSVPQLHDLRDSGELEQHADSVMFVHREHYYRKREVEAKEAAGERISNEERMELMAMENCFDVIVAKQRMGKTGKAALECEMAYNLIRDKVA